MHYRKVVTSEEMSRIDKLACGLGSSEADFMERAGIGVAEIIYDFIEKNSKERKVYVFCGKGNNGGDGYTAALHLKNKGLDVEVIQLFGYNECSNLCKIQSDRFQKLGGVIHPIQNHSDIKLSLSGVVIDALVGTGFKGGAKGLLAEVIEKINASHLPVFSIDIPSGLCGTTGKVETVAIRAYCTIFLELAKIGFFIGRGWDFIGKLRSVSFGLPKQYIDSAAPEAFLPVEKDFKGLLPEIKRSRHKYEAGYVIAVAGSATMPGAAILSANAAIHSGAGMVRLFHPHEMEELYSAPVEIIREGWDLEDFSSIDKQMKKGSALLVGPGVGRDKKTKKMLKSLFSKTLLPSVIDADALHFLSENPYWKLPDISVLTPHVGEMQKLLEAECILASVDFFHACQKYAAKKDVVLVVKGAPTIIFYHNKVPVIMPYGDPGMATAGSGDVLTGVIAALLAQKVPAYEAALLGVYLHAIAGSIAASDKTSYCMVASDIITYLPKAFEKLLKSERVG